MAKVTFRLPSKKIQYGYAEVEMDSMGLSATALGEMYAKYVLDFQAGEIDAVQSVKDNMKAAEDLLKSELGATKISESVNENAAQDGADELTHSEKAAVSTTPPWSKSAPATAAKPWENQAPKVSLF